MIYELSIAFQLTGSILLLVDSWSKIKIGEKALEMCFPGSNIVERDDKNNCVIKKEKLQENVKTIFLNVWSFACLVVGYLLSIFGENNHDNLLFTSISVVVLTVGFIILGRYLAGYMSKAWYKEDKIVPYEELRPMGVDTVITKQEVEEMWNKVFEDTQSK